MTAVATLTGALSHRMMVRGLQARMVKVGPQPGVGRGTTAFRKERSQGLSGMQGNLHVPFLGGWVGAIPPGYPAAGSNPGSLAGQFVEGQRGRPGAREGIEEARVFAGDRPGNGEQIHRLYARFYALQSGRLREARLLSPAG